MSERHPKGRYRPQATARKAVAGVGRGRGPADPVLALMHRHHGLCARAVDPLEIAAGLEAHGITDRVAAARFRHHDVFALAEELYARVPRDPAHRGGGTADGGAEPARAALTAGRTVVHLLPGLACGAGVAASRLLAPTPDILVGGLALTAAVATGCAALRNGPLRAPGRRGCALGTCWLLAFALYGPWALALLLGPTRSAATGGPLDAQNAAGLVARALALLPAAWCARRFASRAPERLAASRGAERPGAAVRPLLAGTLALFTAALLGLLLPAYLALDGGTAGTDLVALGGSVTLGLLLFTARLLIVHGFPGAATAGTAAACAVEAGVLVLAAVRPAAGPLRSLVATAGPGSVQAAACSAAALALVGYATRALVRDRAHRPAGPRGPLYDPAYAAALFGSPHAFALVPAYTPGPAAGRGRARR